MNTTWVTPGCILRYAKTLKARAFRRTRIKLLVVVMLCATALSIAGWIR